MSIWRHSLPAHRAAWPTPSLRLLLLVCWICALFAHGMTDDQLRNLRQETTDLFYHGFDNYMTHAFPEDELRPLACGPLTRDRENPAHIEVNDVLGNYSLTLIDSLSTLAILASSPEPLRNRRDPWKDFQNGVESLIDLYGDGTDGPRGHGKRSKGFDLDSKVQVFETVIRGIGGLVSAHLFASGELPVHDRAIKSKGITTSWKNSSTRQQQRSWPTGFTYDGQLLRLAVDLADRLVPAFYTATGLPYPRVNLRSGVPFYLNSPLNVDSERGVCEKEPLIPLEITETCSAGAGSLVLEFTTLTHLTGDPKYAELAKRAFWAVWERRSEIGLLGAGVDAETGQWVSSYAGIGAGIDSFFEYALKSHILLSSAATMPVRDDSETFLSVWEDAHAGIKRHIYRSDGYQHPHYIQSDLFTGASKAFWVDSLSAFYPGLLVLGGEVDEAIETHLLYTALWTRYAALPERWSTATSTIDAGLRWWGGRPEFIESTWYIYRATQDPFYLHVGEMALKDIKRRCWTPCGWAGLEDVRTGELKDRMESFFLGETAKYLYLLFDTDHPLNKLDAPFVFTTEGHPLLLPESTRKRQKPSVELHAGSQYESRMQTATCQNVPTRVPFSISVAASRPDLFHAAGLARLHQVGITPGIDSALPLVESSYNTDAYADVVQRSPNNYTFYPWTLPAEYIPSNGTSSRMQTREMFDLMFPTLPNTAPGTLFVNRVDEGILINAVSALKLSMTKELGFVDGTGITEVFRVHSVGQMNLGRDEKVFIALETVANLNPADQYFTRHKDLGMLDLVLDMPNEEPMVSSTADIPAIFTMEVLADDPISSQVHNGTSAGDVDQPIQSGLLNQLLQHFQQAFDPSAVNSIAALVQQAQQHFQQPVATASPITRSTIAASISTGLGSAAFPSVPDAALDPATTFSQEGTFWSTIYLIDDSLCDTTQPLPVKIPQKHQVLVIRRGDCAFNVKLRSIPSFAPSSTALQLVIVVSSADKEDAQDGALIRPFLDEEQVTPGGMKRVHGIPMVMVDGGEETWTALKSAKRVGIRRRYWYSSQGFRVNNVYII